MQCTKCHKTISEQQSYVYAGKSYCEDCVMDLGLSGKPCDPWATYVDNRERIQEGQTGSAGLNEMQKKVYDLVAQMGKATRQDITRNLNITDADLSLYLTALMHVELIKEQSENKTQYLVKVK